MFNLLSRSLLIAALVIATAGLASAQAKNFNTTRSNSKLAILIITGDTTVALTGTVFEHGVLVGDDERFQILDLRVTVSGHIDHGRRLDENILPPDRNAAAGQQATGNGSNPSALGDPIPGIDVSLEQIPAGNSLIRDQLTDAQGQYTFATVPSNAIYRMSWEANGHAHAVQVVVGHAQFVENHNNSRSN